MLEYKFKEAPESNVLWVICSPILAAPGKFAYENRAQVLTDNILFIKDTADHFCVDHLDKLIRMITYIKVQKRITRVVYWGSSGGAYTAILLGTDDPSGTVVAFSPHLHMHHPFSVAAKLFGARVAQLPADVADLRGRLNAARAEVKLFFPIVSGKDAVHVRDSLDLDGRGRVSCTYVMSDHGIEYLLLGRGMSAKDIFNLAFGWSRIPGHLIATEEQLKQCHILADLFHCEHCNVTFKGEIPRTPDLVNYELLYWSARQHWRAGDRFLALGLALTAAKRNKDTGYYQCTLGRMAFACGVPSVAHEAFLSIGDQLETDASMEQELVEALIVAIYQEDDANRDRWARAISKRPELTRRAIAILSSPDFLESRFQPHAAHLLATLPGNEEFASLFVASKPVAEIAATPNLILLAAPVEPAAPEPAATQETSAAPAASESTAAPPAWVAPAA
jgi:hypothetical protein